MPAHEEVPVISAILAQKLRYSGTSHNKEDPVFLEQKILDFGGIIMAEMGLGYGSEFQLLRFLGHHRIELNDIIHKNTKLTKEFLWFDFPKDTSENPRLSLDDENKIIDFLSNLKNYKEIKANWEKYWPSRGQHWDAIILNADDVKWEYVIVKNFEVGDPEKYLEYSDHCPITVTMDG